VSIERNNILSLIKVESSTVLLARVTLGGELHDEWRRRSATMLCYKYVVAVFITLKFNGRQGDHLIRSF
jgi:hypothetical protein